MWANRGPATPHLLTRKSKHSEEEAMEQVAGRAISVTVISIKGEKRKSPGSGKELYMQWQKKIQPFICLGWPTLIVWVILKENLYGKNFLTQDSKTCWAILGLRYLKTWNHPHWKFPNKGWEKSMELAKPSHLHLLQRSCGVIERHKQKTTTNINRSYPFCLTSLYNSDNQWKSTSRNPESEK